MSTLQSKQTGVVLVIGLLMLLIITIVGVTAMSGTTNNERMTANLQFQTLSFQAAESAINDNYNLASLGPAINQFPAREIPPANNYDVDVTGNGTNDLTVVANASIQFCGEEIPMGTDLSGPHREQIFDVRGRGQVSALGMQEEHLRRGGRPMSVIGEPFDNTVCTQVP